VDLAVIHSCSRSPAWSGEADLAMVRRIVGEQLDDAERGPVNLSPLYRYLSKAGADVSAARCVREIADSLASTGLASVVPELKLRRGRVDVDVEITKPERRRVLSPSLDRLPLLGFACFVVLIAGCMLLSGG
jgi:hypothetical protein